MAKRNIINAARTIQWVINDSAHRFALTRCEPVFRSSLFLQLFKYFSQNHQRRPMQSTELEYQQHGIFRMDRKYQTYGLAKRTVRLPLFNHPHQQSNRFIKQQPPRLNLVRLNTNSRPEGSGDCYRIQPELYTKSTRRRPNAATVASFHSLGDVAPIPRTPSVVIVVVLGCRPAGLCTCRPRLSECFGLNSPIPT